MWLQHAQFEQREKQLETHQLPQLEKEGGHGQRRKGEPRPSALPAIKALRVLSPSTTQLSKAEAAALEAEAVAQTAHRATERAEEEQRQALADARIAEMEMAQAQEAQQRAIRAAMRARSAACPACAMPYFSF